MSVEAIAVCYHNPIQSNYRNAEQRVSCGRNCGLVFGQGFVAKGDGISTEGSTRGMDAGQIDASYVLWNFLFKRTIPTMVTSDVRQKSPHVVSDRAYPNPKLSA